MNRRTATRMLVALAVAATYSSAAAPAQAINPRGYPTWLISRAADGGFPDGPSTGAVISLDRRIGQVVAFESAASNLVENDGNGHVTDVFAVTRQAPYAGNGTEWQRGATTLISRGRSGRPANGPSWGAAVSGWVKGAPHCVAFVSAASNLVEGDTNGKADAFLYRWKKDIGDGRISRVSLSSSGAQAGGNSFEVALDGDCSHVAFSSTATNLALTRTSRPDWESAVTRKPERGTRQIYVRTLSGFEGGRDTLAGLTALVSQRHGRPGNGDSSDPQLSHAIDRTVAFSSEASNLAAGDANGASDVYAARLTVRKGRYRPATTLVSGRGGHAGAGPSQRPAIGEVGDIIAYDTAAADLGGRPGSQVVLAEESGRRWDGRPITAGLGDGSSFAPSVTTSAGWVFFETDLTATRRGADTNGARDVYLHTVNDGATSRVSYDQSGEEIAAGARRVATSSKGNYVLFDSEELSIDRELYLSHPLPAIFARPSGAARPLPQAPALSAANQVYLHWMGPE